MSVRRTSGKAISLLLAMTMLFGCILPAAASAEDETPSVDLASSAALDLVFKLLKSSTEAAFSEGVSWGVEALLDLAFGKSLSSEEAIALQKILDEIEQLQNEVSELKDDVEGNALDALLQAYSQLGSNQIPGILFESLRMIDEEVLPDDEKAQRRLSVLTDSIGAGGSNLGNINTSFDQYVYALVNALLNTSYVTVEGKQQNLMLFQVHHEYLRRKYHWEHQALEEWYSFQTRAVGMLLQTLMLERLSLHARLDLITAHNQEYSEQPELMIAPEPVIQAINNLERKDSQNPGIIQRVVDLYVPKDEQEPEWMPQPHEDDTRYYWKPGHELLLEARVNRQDVPKEPRQDQGWHDAYYGAGGELQGITNGTTASEFTKISWPFWKPFFRPQPTRLLTEAELKMIFSDYNNKADIKKSFYEIFMDEKEGNFQGLVGEENWDWKIVFDPDSRHLELHWPFGYDYLTIEGYFFDAKKSDSMPNAEKLKIARYHRDYNREIDDTCFIGIRVKKADGEEPEIGGVHLAVYNDENPAAWIPEDGDLCFDLDEAVFGTVITVEADSCELPPSCCSISGNHVTLDADYLSTLAEGVHTFTVHAEGGSESYIYSIGGPAELVLPADTQIVEQAAFAGVGAKSVRIDDACTQIGKNAFAACPDLTWVYIPNSVSQIGEGAFDDCPNLLLIIEEGGIAAEYAASMQLPYRLSKSRSAS